MNLKAGSKSTSSQSQNSNTNVNSWCESSVPCILGSGPYLGDVLFAISRGQHRNVAVLGTSPAKRDAGTSPAKRDAGTSLDPIGIHYRA